MRKITLSITATLLLLMMTGCASMQVTNTDMIVAQIAAKRIGFYVGQNNPNIVPTARIIAQGIIASETSGIAKAALDLAIVALAEQFPDDPLLESDLRLIASCIQLDVPDVQLDLAVLRPIVAAFIQGMRVAVE